MIILSSSYAFTQWQDEWCSFPHKSNAAHLWTKDAGNVKVAFISHWMVKMPYKLRGWSFSFSCEKRLIMAVSWVLLHISHKDTCKWKLNSSLSGSGRSMESCLRQDGLIIHSHSAFLYTVIFTPFRPKEADLLWDFTIIFHKRTSWLGKNKASWLFFFLECRLQWTLRLPTLHLSKNLYYKLKINYFNGGNILSRFMPHYLNHCIDHVTVASNVAT